MSTPTPPTRSRFDPYRDAVVGEAYQAACEAAADDWHRLGGASPRLRIALVADRAWRAGYTMAALATATDAAAHVAVAASTAGTGRRFDVDDRTGHCLHQLRGAAIAAGSAYQPLAPPAPARTVVAATAAVALPPPIPPLRRVAALAWADALRAGAITGTVTVATDILREWRTRLGRTSILGTRIDGAPAVDWVADLLRHTNRVVAAPWVATSDTATTGADQTGTARATTDLGSRTGSTQRGGLSSPATAPTPAQLAGQDAAPGVAARVAGPADRRGQHRPAGGPPNSSPNRRSR